MPRLDKRKPEPDSGLRVEYLAVSGLLPYARNSRTHSDAQVSQIAASIKAFGFTNPILISEGSDIIAGHGRALAAAKLGMSEVPCIRLGHLTETQRRAYVIADNRLALNAGWDTAMLSLELQELQTSQFDMKLLGFDPEEMADIMLGPDFKAGSEDDQGKLDEKAKISCPECGHEFTT